MSNPIIVDLTGRAPFFGTGPAGILCPHCGSEHVFFYDGELLLYRCECCYAGFSVDDWFDADYDAGYAEDYEG